MRLQLTLITAITSCVAGRALNVGNPPSSSLQMGLLATTITEKPGALPRQVPPGHGRPRIKFKRDGSIQAFFDEDFANDADWKKFSEKGGALV